MSTSFTPHVESTQLITVRVGDLEFVFIDCGMSPPEAGVAALNINELMTDEERGRVRVYTEHVPKRFVRCRLVVPGDKDAVARVRYNPGAPTFTAGKHVSAQVGRREGNRILANMLVGTVV